MAEINGYHLFGLTGDKCAVKEYAEGISFTTLENDLSDGYESQLLFGSNTGLRRWRLTLPTLTGGSLSDRTVEGPNGEICTYEEYLWTLFCETQVTGRPFALQSSRNGQYYLCRFANKELTYERMLTKLYSTGIELKQVRVQGATVFDVGTAIGSGRWFDETVHNSPRWGVVGTNPGFDSVGGVTFGANPQNGLNTVRFDGLNDYAELRKGGGPSEVTAFDIFAVIKVREATFSTNSGIINDNGVTDYLRGDDGTALFANLGLADFEYRLNGIEYAQSAMQAPMNEFGIVHLRFLNGQSFAMMTLGRSVAGVYAPFDIGELIVTVNLATQSIFNEIMEYLAVKWQTGA